MKKILLILLTVGLVSGAQAQFRGGHVGGGFYGGGEIRTGVVVGGYAPYYGYRPYWGFAFGYPYLYPYGYGYPYGPYSYGYSRLQSQIEGIKQDYADRIESVRMDNTITGKERRAQIRQLKKDRDSAVDQAKRDYWKTPRTNGSAQNPGNQPNTGAPANSGNQPNAGSQNQSGTENQAGSSTQQNNNPSNNNAQ